MAQLVQKKRTVVLISPPFDRKTSIVWSKFMLYNPSEVHEPYKVVFPDCFEVIDPQGDPLHRWRECQHAFPHVSKVAKRYLAVPGSSAASERAFSSAGLVITKKRTSLRPDNAEALFLLKHHWDSQGMFRETQKRLTQRQHQEEGVDDPYDEPFQQDQPQQEQFSDEYDSDNNYNVAGGEEDEEEAI